MARRHKRGQRDVSTSSLDRSSLLSDLVLPAAVQAVMDEPADLSAVEDNRLFHPEAPYAAPLFVSGNAVRVGPKEEFGINQNRTRALMENPNKQSSYNARATNAMYFDQSQHVVRCIRRKVRREVMFASGKGRRKKGSLARRRRNQWSDVNC